MKGEISVNSIRFDLAGVQSFLEFNEIVLPWKKYVKYDIPKIEVTILQNGLLKGVEITSIVVPVHRGG